MKGGGSRDETRPLWLLGEPELLADTQSSDAPPGLQLERGPERIETGWWDGHEVARDYFIARAAHGARWWIYRQRGASRRWYLHGLFA